jgi:protocatechuate 3,4-dioxygenase beta subunit
MKKGNNTENTNNKTIDRRDLLKSSAITALSVMALPKMALAVNECLNEKTPAQTEGPFYPIKSQLDTDADLVVVKGARSSAKGKIIFVQGVVTDQHCRPVKGALVEIWQACESGRYNHPSDPNTAPLDPNFQYWGKAVTDANGNYRFRTIIPGAYPADTDWVRPPHIHFKVSKKGYLELITQMYFAGESLNQTDKILNRLSKSQQQEVIVPLVDDPVTKLPKASFPIQIEKLG